MAITIQNTTINFVTYHGNLMDNIGDSFQRLTNAHSPSKLPHQVSKSNPPQWRTQSLPNQSWRKS